jgi:hypothetical protein
MFIKLLTIFFIILKSLWTATCTSLENIFNPDGSKGIYL